MTTTEEAVHKTVKAFSAIRKEADERIRSKVDVVGSMVGLKVKRGSLTKQVSLSYFVREKIPQDQLSPRERIPKSMTVQGTAIATDVSVWPRMMVQAAPVPTILFDGKAQGTLSCFSANDTRFFGVSCAHCMAGVDDNPTTPALMEFWDASSSSFLTVGDSIITISAPGSGIPGSFGYLDCGLFDLGDSALEDRAAAGVALPVVSDIHSLMGMRLTAMSALKTNGSTDPVRSAVVTGLELEALGQRADVILTVDSPGTIRGDSGMMWMTDDGRAAAIHAQGELLPNDQGSLLTTAMSAARAAMALQVQFVSG